jgi:beta-glucosidase
LGIYHVRGTLEKPGRDYVFSSPDPLWPFGFGLSYTTFSYSDLKIDNQHVSRGGEISLSFSVTNAGDRSGKEVAQVYFADEISSTTTPTKRLIRFKKVALEPGETKRVQFSIDTSELAIWNQEMVRVVEPGAFTLMVGASAVDIKLTDRFFVSR